MKDFGGIMVFLSVLSILFIGFFGIASSSPNVAPVCLDFSSDFLESSNQNSEVSLADLEGSSQQCLSGGSAKKEKTCRNTAKPVDVCDTVSNGTVLCGSNNDQACVYQCICQTGAGCKWTHQTYCTSGKCDPQNSTICKE